MFTEAVAVVTRPPWFRRSPFIFLRPFVSHLWLYILCAVPVMATVLYLVDQRSATSDNKAITFGESVWFVYGAMLSQGGANLPTSHAARLVMAAWWMVITRPPLTARVRLIAIICKCAAVPQFQIVLVATYIGNLISFLAFPERKWLIASIDDFA